MKSLLSDRRSCWALALVYPLVFGALWVRWTGEYLPANLATVSGAITFSLLGLCAVTDYRWRIVPNWATYSAAAWAVGLNVYAARVAEGESLWPAYLGAVGIEQSLLGALACFFIMFCIFGVAKGGAGDVKLAAAIGALVGLERGFIAIGYTFVLAGIGAMCLVIWKLGPLEVAKSLLRQVMTIVVPLWVQSEEKEHNRAVFQMTLPLATYFAIGAPLALLPLPGLTP